jgi:hypothetical protein
MSARKSGSYKKVAKNPARGSGIKTSTPLRFSDRKANSVSSKSARVAKIPAKTESSGAEIKTSTPQRTTRRHGSSKKIEIKDEDLNAMIENSTPLRPSKKVDVNVSKSPDSEIEAGMLKSVDRKRRSGSRRLLLEEVPVAVSDANSKKRIREAKKV